MSDQDGLPGAVFTMRETSGRSPVILRPQGRPFPATAMMDWLGSSLMGAASVGVPPGGDTVLQVTDPPSQQAAMHPTCRSSSLRGNGATSDSRGASRLTVVTNSPRSRALWVGPSSPERQVGWQDEVDNAPRLAKPLALSGAGNVLAMSPMLCVQLRFGEVTFPALVDSGASDNFIDSDLVLSLQLPLAVPTKIRSANGHLMDCDSYVVVLAVLGSLRFRISMRVVSSTMGIILGIPFLRFFDPRIS